MRWRMAEDGSRPRLQESHDKPYHMNDMIRHTPEYLTLPTLELLYSTESVVCYSVLYSVA